MNGHRAPTNPFRVNPNQSEVLQSQCTKNESCVADVQSADEISLSEHADLPAEIDYWIRPQYDCHSDGMMTTYDGECCDGVGCSCGAVCDAQDYPRPSSWFRAEFINWWVSGLDAPPLVSTSPSGTARASAGVLGQDTSILIGDDLDEDSAQGGRFAIGTDIDNCGEWQFELDYLFLSPNTEGFSAESTGEPILARPFLNVETGLEASALVAFPSFVTGSIHVEANTELQAWDVLVRRRVARGNCNSVQLLFGYRGGNLRESISVSENTIAQDAGAGVPVGTEINLFDRFYTDNEFHGFTLGTSFERVSCRWMADLTLKLSIGATDSHVDIRGQTTTTRPNENPTTIQQGLLALTSNSGGYDASGFAVLPEIGLNLRYRLNGNWTASVGYTLHYWSQAIRPGDVIDRNLNLSQVPPGTLNGAPFPTVDLDPADYLAQGFSIGIEGSY
jgi:hypothetical protein